MRKIFSSVPRSPRKPQPSCASRKTEGARYESKRIFESSFYRPGRQPQLFILRDDRPAFSEWKKDSAAGTRADYIKSTLDHDRQRRHGERKGPELDFVSAPAESVSLAGIINTMKMQDWQNSAADRAEEGKQKRAEYEADQLVLALAQTRSFDMPADSVNARMFSKSARRLGRIAYMHGNTIDVQKSGLVLSADYKTAIDEAAQRLRQVKHKTVTFTVQQ